MRTTSLLPLLLAVALPSPTEAFLADIFSLLVSIFVPDWQGQLCDALTANIPDELGTCGCDVELSGLFDFNVGGTCENVGNLCDVTLGGEGNIFLAAFAGVDLNLATECPLPLGSINIEGGGTLSVGGSDLDSCSVAYNPPSLLPDVGCTCTPNCDSDEPFAVGVVCVGFVDLGCINILDILTQVATLPPPTLPPV